MIRLLIELLLTGLVVSIGAYVVPGVHVDGFGTAILAGVLIALVNATLGFILRILTFPISVLTLGLFSFIITILMVMLVANILDGFDISGFWAAAIFAIVIAILKMIFRVGVSDSR